MDENLSGRKTGFRGKRGPARSERRRFAEEAGISRHKMYQAIAIASIPEDQFDALMEDDKPPSVERLASIGRGADQRQRETGPLSRLKAAWKAASAAERGEFLEWLDEHD